MKKNIVYSIVFLLTSLGLYADDVTGVVTNASMPNCPDGAINLTVTGGFAPYSFYWTGPNNYSASTEDISGLKPGHYTVTVSDALCGEAVAEFNVEVSAVDIYISGKKNLDECSDFGNYGPGYINLSVPGPGYTFSWSGPSGYSSTSQNITNLSTPGNYTVTVTNTAGCTKVLTENICCCIVEPDGPHGGGAPPPSSWHCVPGTFISPPLNPLNANLVSPSGPNSADGSINLIVTGGNGDRFYSWTGPNGFSAHTEDISGLNPGQYCVTVMDGCSQRSACYTLVVCSESNLALSGSASNTCQGYQAGSLSVSVAGGATPYKYKWSNGATTAAINNLAAGQYCVTVTDASGCTKAGCYTVGTSNTTRDNCKIYCNGTLVAESEPYPVFDQNDCRIVHWYCNEPGEDHYLGWENAGIANVDVNPSTCQITAYCYNNQIFDTYYGDKCRNCIIFLDGSPHPDRLVSCHVDYCFYPELNASVILNIAEHQSAVTISFGENICNLELYDHCSGVFGGTLIYDENHYCNQLPVVDGNCSSYFQPGDVFDGNPFGFCDFALKPDVAEKAVRKEIMEKLNVKPFEYDNGDLHKIQELQARQIVLSESMSCNDFAFSFLSATAGPCLIKIQDMNWKTLFSTTTEVLAGRNNVNLQNVVSRAAAGRDSVFIQVVLPNSGELLKLVVLDCDAMPTSRQLPSNTSGDIRVYPNPTDGIVNVELVSEIKKIYSFELFNALGASVMTINQEYGAGKSAAKIDLTHLPAGAYLLVVKGPDGATLLRENVAKQ